MGGQVGGGFGVELGLDESLLGLEVDILEDVFAGEGQWVGIFRGGRPDILFVIFMDQFDEHIG